MNAAQLAEREKRNGNDRVVDGKTTSIQKTPPRQSQGDAFFYATSI